MSRFDQGRWNRVVVWTGAALAWGSAFVATRLEPERDAPQEPAPAAAQVDDEMRAPFPVLPAQGIVVIRQAGSTAPVPAAAADPQPSPSPAPVSQGS